MAQTGYNQPPPNYGQATGYPSYPSAPPPQYPPPGHGSSYGYAPQPQPQSQPVIITSDTNAEAGEWASPGFSEKKIRLAFIRKVYMILSCQLLVTVAFICFFLFHAPTKTWVQGSGRWFYYLAYGVFLVMYITLVCCSGVRRKWPGNFICLAIFTVAFSYMTATISSYHNVEAVLYAAGITTIVCIAVSIFACQTKFDFTKCGGLIFCLMLVLLLFGLGCMIAYFVAPIDKRTHMILQCTYGSLGALVFTLFLAFDTQMLIGGKKHEISEEEHIYAALQLYLDVVYIFLFILMIFGGAKD